MFWLLLFLFLHFLANKYHHFTLFIHLPLRGGEKNAGLGQYQRGFKRTKPL